LNYSSFLPPVNLRSNLQDQTFHTYDQLQMHLISVYPKYGRDKPSRDQIKPFQLFVSTHQNNEINFD